MSNTIYQALEGPKSIRLALLAPGTEDADISCELIYADIDFEHPYLALSYVWGDPSETVSITVNDTPLHVTKNLNSALRKIRDKESYSLIWIDAICINQSDIQERNQQVKIMRQIYKSASKVLIYVGDETPNTRDAMDLISLLNLISEKLNPNPADPAILFEGSPEGEALPKPDSPQWDHFQDFFRRPWFERAWVLQECAVAASDPMVICGEYWLPWAAISRVAGFVHSTGLAMGRPNKDRSYHAVVMSRCHDNLDQCSIQRLLRWTRRFQATDPRDRLFALYGLAADMPDQGKYDAFDIDYSKPVSEIYTQFARGHISYFGSPDILMDVDRSQPRRIEGLPSWAPDWSAPVGSPPFGINGISEQYRSSEGFGGSVISDAGDPNVLRIGACLNDEVSWVSDPFEDEDTDILPAFRRPGLLMRIWNEIITRLGPKSDHSVLAENFWRTLIANVDQFKKPATDRFFVLFLCYWRMIRIADQASEKYIAEHHSRPSFDDYEARKRIKSEHDAAQTTSDEFYAALQRMVERAFAEAGIKCTNDPQTKDGDCKHCKAVQNPELITGVKVPPVQGKDDAYELHDTDPFIKEYFRRLEGDVMEPINIVEGSANEFVMAFLQACSQRAIFITKNGLLGLGPRNTQIGDKIAVLSGGSMPFVLRETNVVGLSGDVNSGLPIMHRRYTLMGPSYVHGIMNGEALEVVEPGAYKWTMIDLM